MGTLATLVSASAAGGKVQVSWELGAAASATLYRSVDDGAWSRVGVLSVDGLHRINYVDEAVVAGHRYGYRLGLGSGTGEVVAGETWVDVPLKAVFALQGARPNPTAGPLSVSFSLADDSPATLAILDLSGRRVFERQVGNLGPGNHVVRLERAQLRSGIYAVRLTQAGRTLTSKVTIVH